MSRWAALAAAGGVVLLLLWGLYLAGHPAPEAVARTAVAATVAAGLVALGQGWRRRWRAGDREERAALVLLTLLLLAALAVRVPGIGHEVTERYYADEGTYLHHASEINQGRVLRTSFFYPHLLYYVDAFALWLAALFAGPVQTLAGSLTDAREWADVCRLVLRFVSALFGAAMVWPVFALGRRLGGVAAGGLAGALVVFSSELNMGSHIHTCDLPSAFFAAVALALCGRLLERESLADYLLAGVAAGLAAGSKYPAGLVAVAILAVWLRWRLAERRLDLSLAWAALAALATFLLTTPALLADPAEGLFGRYGVLLGFRQYSRGGWIGVVVESNALYYLRLAAGSFGWPALLLGAAGLPLMGREARRRLLWVLPFPALYLGTILAMNIVAERNLYPALPALAVVLGVGIAALCGRLAPRRALAAAAAVAALALPVATVAAQQKALLGRSTRQLASEWMHESLPPGAVVLKEGYTPNLDPGTFGVVKIRFAGVHSLEELRRMDVDYLLLSSISYERFLDPEQHFEAHHAIMERNYRSFFAELPPVLEIVPRRTRLGPELRLHRVPAALPVRTTQRIPASAGRPLKGAMHGEAATVRHRKSHRWWGFRLLLGPGRHRLVPVGKAPGEAVLRLVDAAGREVAFARGQAARGFELPAAPPGRYFLYLYLSKESEVREWRLEPAAGAEPGEVLKGSE